MFTVSAAVNRHLRLRFSRILKRAAGNATMVMRGLVQAGVMRASPRAASPAASATITLKAADALLSALSESRLIMATSAR